MATEIATTLLCSSACRAPQREGYGRRRAALAAAFEDETGVRDPVQKDVNGHMRSTDLVAHLPGAAKISGIGTDWRHPMRVEVARPHDDVRRRGAIGEGPVEAGMHPDVHEHAARCEDAPDLVKHGVV